MQIYKYNGSQQWQYPLHLLNLPILYTRYPRWIALAPLASTYLQFAFTIRNMPYYTYLNPCWWVTTKRANDSEKTCRRFLWIKASEERINLKICLKIRQWRPIRRKVCWRDLLTCWFLLNYFFDPEDGGDMILRNVGCNSTDYTASYPRKLCSS
jgi:hypothetical protein